MSWGIVASVGVGLLTSQQGSKGSSSTTTKEMDPRMAPYVFGDSSNPGLLLQGVQAQLARSQSPERMQGWNNMMNRGQQLMGGSVAGNPFASGYRGGTDFGPGGGANGLGQYVPQAIPMTPPQQQQQQRVPTLDEIWADMERRRLAALQQGSYGYSDGGPGNDGPGDSSTSGTSGVGDAAASGVGGGGW